MTWRHDVTASHKWEINNVFELSDLKKHRNKKRIKFLAHLQAEIGKSGFVTSWHDVMTSRHRSNKKLMTFLTFLYPHSTNLAYFATQKNSSALISHMKIVSLNWEISQNEFLIDIVGAIEVVWTTPLIKNINIKIINFLCDIFHETFPMWNFRCGESRVKCHIYVTLKVDCGIDWTVISLRHQY